jgi:signal peptidase I
VIPAREDASSAPPGARPVWLAGTGWSMFPTLLPRDVLRLEPVTREPRVGDVVAVRRAGRLLIHRIVATPVAALWFTKGDAMVECDPPTRTDEIAGIVTMRRRRSALVALDTDAGRAALSLEIGSLVARRLPRRLRALRRPVYLATFLLAVALGWQPGRSRGR